MPMLELLRAEGPFPAAREHPDLFGRFIGDWDLDWHGDGLDGKPAVVAGEVRFGWILEGRAIQDVWRVPSSPKDGAGMRGFHGTTMRFYDPGIGAWRSTWLDPLNGRVRRFIGRQDDGGILLEGLDGNPQERWRFLDIEAHRFRWTAEESLDGGRTWVHREEMHARRRAGSRQMGLSNCTA